MMVVLFFHYDDSDLDLQKIWSTRIENTRLLCIVRRVYRVAYLRLPGISALSVKGCHISKDLDNFWNNFLLLINLPSLDMICLSFLNMISLSSLNIISPSSLTMISLS